MESGQGSEPGDVATVEPKSGRTGPRFSQTERERIRADIVRLEATRAYTQREIAAIVGVSLAFVSKTLIEIRAEYKNRALNDMMEDRARVLAECHMLKSELIGAWHRSREPKNTAEAQTTGTKAQVTAKGKGKKGTRNVIGEYREKTKLEAREGDPAYINSYIRVLERESAILGIDMPKIGPGGQDGGGDAGAINMNTYNVLVVTGKDEIGEWQEKYARQMETGQGELVAAGEDASDTGANLVAELDRPEGTE